MGDFLIRKQNCLKLIVQQRFCNDFVGTSSEQKYHLDSNAHKILLATVASRPFCINIDKIEVFRAFLQVIFILPWVDGRVVRLVWGGRNGE